MTEKTFTLFVAKQHYAKPEEDSIKKYFEEHRNMLISRERSVAEIFKLVENGYAIFPLSSDIPMRNVNNLTRMGLSSVYLAPQDYKKFLRAYAEFITGDINEGKESED